MSTAIRTIRPFHQMHDVEGLATRFRLVVDDMEFEPGARVQVTPADYLQCSVALRLVESETPFRDALAQAAEQAEVPSDALGVVIVATTPRLKSAEILADLRGDDLARLDTKLVLATPLERPTAFRAPFGGTTLGCYLALTRALEPAPLRPWRFGTWLARASYRLDTSLGQIGFTPLPLTADERERLGLGPNVLRFAEIDPSEVLTAGDADTIRLWVDEELLTMLSLYPRSAGAITLQRQLFLDAMSSLVTVAASSEEFANISAADLEATLLGSLLDWIADVAAGADEQTRLAARASALQRLRGEPLLTVALIEDRIAHLRRDLVATIKGGA